MKTKILNASARQNAATVSVKRAACSITAENAEDRRAKIVLEASHRQTRKANRRGPPNSHRGRKR